MAGGSIWADSQTSLVVTYTPVNKVEDKSHPQVFPTCAVTRAQACLKKNTLEEKKEEKVPLNVVLPLLVFPFSVSRSGLIQKQQNDPTLVEVF